MTTHETLPEPGGAFGAFAEFVLGDLAIPEPVLEAAGLYILDLIGVAASATRLEVGRIARDHAVKHWAAGEGAPSARLLFDGRRASLPGAGFALATQIDNLDAHDGWQPSLGHAGAALFPALAAFAEDAPDLTGREALTAMVVGYETAYRAALALHATVEDYHTSGAWNGIGCAAIGARLRGASPEILRHALGIAEYHAPRSQMMREIANPSMMHDGTGFGAPTGIYALLIAEDGFLGAPAALVEFADAAFAWESLGTEWLTTQQYIKPYPICRWAHAPIDAALGLRATHGIALKEIAGVEIATFGYSAALNCDVPTSTSNAQYSLAWPVACALVRGRVGTEEVLEASFVDADLQAMLGRVSVQVDPEIDALFPARRAARVTLTLRDGRVLESGLTDASGGPDPQMTRAEVVAKYRAFAGPVLGEARTTEIEQAVLGMNGDGRFAEVMALLVDAPKA